MNHPSFTSADDFVYKEIEFDGYRLLCQVGKPHEQVKNVPLFGLYEFESEKCPTIGDGEIVITKYIGNASHAVIPAYIDIFRVIGVGEEAFYENETLQSVYFEEGITRIGESAFYGCKRLRTVHLPSTLKKIDQCAFENSAVETLNLPCGLFKIGSCAFRNTNIKKLTLPDSLETLGGWSFMDCKKLTHLKMPSNIRHFVDYEGDADPDDMERLFFGDDTYSYLGDVRTFDGCSSLRKVDCDFRSLGLNEEQIRAIFNGTVWYKKRQQKEKSR